MHIAEVVTIAKSLPLLRLNTYKSLILSYSADYRRILSKKTPYLQVFGIRLDTFNRYFLDYNIHLRTFARKKRRNETFHNKHQLEKFRIYRLRLP